MDTEKVFRHCVRVERHENGYVPYRYEADALKKFAEIGHPGAKYGPGSAGITLDFFTDAEEVSFQCEVLNGLTYGKMEYFDIWENDTWVESMEWDGFRPFKYNRRIQGYGRVTIYLPILYELSISDLNLGNWEPVKQEDKKVLILGDSIAHGLRGSYPSMGLSVSFARELKMDYLNLAVGGAIHDEMIVGCAPEYSPDRILVHLGTNDVNRLDSLETCRSRIRTCYADIARRWPEIPVDVISPVWRLEFFNGSELGKRRLGYACQVRDLMFEEGEKCGFSVYDGLKISPNSAQGLADHCHPNDLGFQIYLSRFLKEMRRKDT